MSHFSALAPASSRTRCSSRAERARVALIDDPAVVQHIGAVGDLDRGAHVLLDQQHRDAFPPRRGDDL